MHVYSVHVMSVHVVYVCGCACIVCVWCAYKCVCVVYAYNSVCVHDHDMWVVLCICLVMVYKWSDLDYY